MFQVGLRKSFRKSLVDVYESIKDECIKARAPNESTDASRIYGYELSSYKASDLARESERDEVGGCLSILGRDKVEKKDLLLISCVPTSLCDYLPDR